MLNKFTRILMILMLLVAQMVSAEIIHEQQDFAFVATLSDGKQSIRQFELPYPMLAGLARQDYGDMRIFNSQNQPVPFTVTQPEPQTQQNTNRYELRFFRLADKSAKRRSGLQIEFDDHGSHLSFNAVNGNHEPANYLIVENTHQAENLQSIKLTWRQPSDAFSIKVKLESSDNLQNWQALNDGTTLYNLKHLDTALIQDTLNLPDAVHAKYLRLSFQPSGSFTLRIEKISGEYRHTTTIARENWQTFQLEPGEKPDEWLFDTGSYAPLTKIDFEIPAAGLFYQGSLYSRDDTSRQPDPNRDQRRFNFKRDVKRVLHRDSERQINAQDAWRYQGSVTQYRLLTAFGEIKSGPITVPATKDRRWKLVLDQPSSLLPPQIPVIKGAWRPVVVTFLAQGNPPYQLFFGNPGVKATRSALPPLLNDNNIEKVHLLKVRAVEKTAPATEPEKLLKTLAELDWRKILLWLLLCSGVLVMGLMAYQLFVRMNRKKD